MYELYFIYTYLTLFGPGEGVIFARGRIFFLITPQKIKLSLQNFLTINKYLLGIFCENVKKLYPNVYVIIAQLFNTHTHMRTHDSRPIL